MEKNVSDRYNVSSQLNKPFCSQDGNYDRFKINPDWLAEIWNCLLLRTGVNFINVLRTNFLYERRFSSYILALSKNSYDKFARLKLMKLTAGIVNNLNSFTSEGTQMERPILCLKKVL